ncbi:hypothetical protein KR222_001649, partial [Zaprionus bogoriensis]
ATMSLTMVSRVAGVVPGTQFPIVHSGDQRQSLSWQDLVRQKFILDIVQRVQQPLEQDDLIQLDQGLIMKSDRYRGGIDADMQRVIDLDRQRRLLDEHQTFSIRNVEHVQQLRGIYRLLVRAIEFETLQRNVIYLRRNVNPVLLVNALTLAIRDREDSQVLIVPAVQEILPELYLDQQTIQLIQDKQQQVQQSQRASFEDLISLRQRMRVANPMMKLVMPWRDLGLQMAQRRKQLQQTTQTVVVVPPVQQNEAQDISLLTEDIGMRNFVQNLIKELALLEESENARRDDDIVGNGYTYGYQQQDQQGNEYGNQRDRFLDALQRRSEDDEQIQSRSQQDRYVRVPLQRNIGRGIDQVTGGFSSSSSYRNSDDQVGQLPTVSIDDERLVHVGRRRQYDSRIQPEQQLLDRYGGVIRGERLSEGRRVEEEPAGRRVNSERNQQRYQYQYNNQYQQQEDDESVQDDPQSSGRRLATVSRNDDRLVYINRRRFDQSVDDSTPRRVSPIGEGRRVGPMTDEDIVQLIRRDHRLEQLSDDEVVEMLRRNRQQREQERVQGVNREQVEEQQRKQNEARLIHLIRQDSQLGQLSYEDIIELLRQERQQLEREQNGRQRSRRSLVSPVEQQTLSRRSEIILQTLRQLLARINQERISVRLNTDDVQQIDNSRFVLPNHNQAQRYALRLFELREESRRNRVLLGRINGVEERLQQVIGQLVRERSTRQGQIDGQLRIERAIGDVLLGQVGYTGIVRILREQLQYSSLVQQDPLGLGFNLGDRVLQYTLRRILSIVDEEREQLLGAYNREQLEMPDVSINDVRVSKLITRIEDYDLDVSNLQEQTEQGQQQQQGQESQLFVRQRRLNNAPFTIDLDVSSERAQDAIVRIFIGPREDAAGREQGLDQRRTDFVLLDAIKVKLQSGRNRIQQRSTNIEWTSRDATPYSEIYRRVMSSIRGQSQEPNSIIDLVGENGRFPQRLLLPRGRPEGLPMQLLVIVSPVEQVEQQRVRFERLDGVLGISQASIQDNRPLGYPLDRRIDNEQQFLRLSNVQIQDVVIQQEN